MHFTKLRLAGFKSFVDPVEMLIEPGTTGIVGPNGGSIPVEWVTAALTELLVGGRVQKVTTRGGSVTYKATHSE